jgi:hypothetical protein
MLRLGEWSQWFVQEKKVYWKVYIIYYIWQTNDNFWKKTLSLELQEGHLDHHRQCPSIQVAIRKSLNFTWRDQTLKSGWRDRDLFLSFDISSTRKQPHNSLSSFCSSKILWIDVVKHLDASVRIEAFSQIQDRYGPLLRFRFFSFPNFLKGVLLPNWKVVEGEIWP